MSTRNWHRFLAGTLGFLIGAFHAVGTVAAEALIVNFDEVAQGHLPTGWTIDATNPGGQLAEWSVVTDPTAPSKPNVLTLKTVYDTPDSVFNLCWTRDIAFADGEIEVKVRANTGKEDQGGGVIWRARDANNYYIARYNPLENNFQIYYVKNGSRKQLASAGRVGILAGEWFDLKIIQDGDKIEGYLNDKKYLEVTDHTFQETGGIGFWTKADAASSFDDLVIVRIDQK